MELFIAGGVGEHGRNCFLLKCKKASILIDCGIMASSFEPYPHLNKEQIKSLTAVFLTHSHNDHTGAIPFLYENGFNGVIVATKNTLKQLNFTIKDYLILEDVCASGYGKLFNLSIEWGRSGHCAGSVWYQFFEEGESIFFSGDYTEDTQVYTYDPIRTRCADIAIIDCAYARAKESYQELCERIVELTKQHKLILFPVPKYGRGLELLKLLSDNNVSNSYYSDELFLDNVEALKSDNYWFKADKSIPNVTLYKDQSEGVVFVSDPQLRSLGAQIIAKKVLSEGGYALMTGTVEMETYSEYLIRENKMAICRYPVHLNYSQFNKILSLNSFKRAIPYHSKELS